MTTAPPSPTDNPSPELQRVLASLRNSVAETPYAVSLDAKHPGPIEVSWKVADQKWNPVFRTQSLSVDQGLRIKLDEPNHRYSLNDTVIHRVSYAGVDLTGLDFGVVKSVQSGRFVNYEAHKSAQFGVVQDDDGGLRVGSSDFGTYTLNTQTMRKAVIAALADAGWAGKPTMSANTK